MERKYKIVIGIILVFLILLAVILLNLNKTSGEVIITLDKTSYSFNENISLTITNNLNKPIYFSGCGSLDAFWYYLFDVEYKQNDVWEPYYNDKWELLNCAPAEFVSQLSGLLPGRSINGEIPISDFDSKGNYRIGIRFLTNCRTDSIDSCEALESNFSEFEII